MDVEVREKDTLKVPFVLTDEDGAPIPLADLTSLTASLHELQENAVVNGRNATNIKNANGGFVHATDGSGYWLMVPDDQTIVNAATEFGQVETHTLLIEGVYQTSKEFSSSLTIGVLRVRNRT